MPSQDIRSPEPRHRRSTPRQRALLDLLRRTDRFRSAQQLHAELLATVRVGLTSVYRILHQFAEQQVVETQRAEDGELLYRLNDSTGHHHNLLCRICGRAEQFTLDALEDHTEHVAHRYRYTDLNHQLDLYGTCPDCAAVHRD
ncbi:MULTISPECIES: Fur family transcriptional regulator [unclassified Nocardia]|uniref:Fur family transcriptional regulator n=1 Tax=unclassified Nocardia TaxID=2637762 RepID=UPI001CE46F3F|nr:MULTISPECIES: Fur family transcriptional regulator [unclassified Nocardia]